MKMDYLTTEFIFQFCYESYRLEQKITLFFTGYIRRNNQTITNRKGCIHTEGGKHNENLNFMNYGPKIRVIYRHSLGLKSKLFNVMSYFQASLKDTVKQLRNENDSRIQKEVLHFTFDLRCWTEREQLNPYLVWFFMTNTFACV